MKKRGFKKLEDIAKIPIRKTAGSAGYDISSLEDYVIKPNEMQIVRTGLTAFMGLDEYLGLHIRSGLAFKHRLTLQNGEGIVDCDYYPNEIKLLIRNEGTESFVINAGDRIAQGIFKNYLKANTDLYRKLEDQFVFKRVDGFGSTGKR